MKRYPSVMIVHGDAVTFTVPDLPGFTAQIDGGPTMEAIAEAEAVLSDYVGAMLDAGQDVPEPRDLPDAARIATDFRQETLEADDVALVVLAARPVGGVPVRVNVSLDSGTLEQIDAAATARGLTRSAYLAEAARAYQ